MNNQQIILPPLADGEIYIGAIGDAQGNLHHVILLPGDNNDANWQAQKEWAASIGGDLPTRIEQAMLWASFRDLFEKNWYWSNEEHHAESGSAWCQYFNFGSQSSTHKNHELRARAVRRIYMEDFVNRARGVSSEYIFWDDPEVVAMRTHILETMIARRNS